MLFKNPGFTIVAVITLALGIGANTAIFSILHSVLFQTLPYKDPEKLVMVLSSNTRHSRKGTSASYPDFLDLQKQNTVFEQMSVFRDKNYTMTGMNEPERVDGGRASWNFFDLLGIRAQIGRTFSESEDKPGAEKVVMISNGFWQRRFGGDPKVIGKNLMLDGFSWRIIGVLPTGFKFPLRLENAQIWSTMAMDDDLLPQRGAHYLSTIARFRSGATLKEAQTQLSAIAKRLEKEYPEDNTGRIVELTPLHEFLVQRVRPGLLLLWGAVVFVLMIGCSNVANLFLARSASREKEVAIRTALGANRSRLMRQMFTESMILAVLAGVIGLCIAYWGTDAMRSISVAGLELADVRLDGVVLFLTLIISFVSGILFGLAPALKASPDSAEALKEGGRSSSGGLQRNRMGRILVISEVALAFVLLIGAGLLIRSFWRLQNVDPGFDPANVLTLEIALPYSQYNDAQSVTNFFEEALHRVSALPGVESAGATTNTPLSGDNSRSSFDLEKHPSPQGQEPAAEIRAVTPNYFKTMHISLLRGRAFTDQDRKGTTGVLLINEAMARNFWPNEDPIGQRIQIGIEVFDDEPKWWQIVGIVANTKQFSLDAETQPEFYIPHAQQPWNSMTLVVRADSNPLSLVGPIKNLVLGIDKNQPISNIQLMDHLVSASIAQPRFYMALLGLFAGVALLLASIGIYGVISYSVSQRTNEMGIRMALGAQKQDVMKMVLTQGIFLIACGIGIGLLAAIAITRLMWSLLFEVSTLDPVTFGVIGLILLAIALLATYVPARRATKVDPMVALRYE
jgi:putative ABC transport system permease protein